MLAGSNKISRVFSIVDNLKPDVKVLKRVRKSHVNKEKSTLMTSAFCAKAETPKNRGYVKETKQKIHRLKCSQKAATLKAPADLGWFPSQPMQTCYSCRSGSWAEKLADEHAEGVWKKKKNSFCVQPRAKHRFQSEFVPWVELSAAVLFPTNCDILISVQCLTAEDTLDIKKVFDHLEMSALICIIAAQRFLVLEVLEGQLLFLFNPQHVETWVKLDGLAGTATNQCLKFGKKMRWTQSTDGFIFG